ncbi:hypothetical protein D0196_24745 [Salmonella enterica subsp. enterica serovar Cerro]|nr:hypothetical protein [Salmonella enterica subsp. enterica serovar Cerro]EAQ6995715.1 hypothetical protein [Salmonella enterica]EAW1649443.1 hypothetical protein [Salmonella enterica subsp. enterica]EAQ1048480.1 hypothetical protein [Salmonella enterica subsp. enterica serovar Cerro]EAR0588873.1 hypothetical protein [Salmonella enterica subsp. enterica serovar Cerro]
MDQQKRLLVTFHLNRWNSPAPQMKLPSQSSGVLHYHRSDSLAIDIPAHQVFTPSTHIYSAIS